MTTNLKYAKSITSFYIKYFRTTTVQYDDREMLTDLIIRAKARLTNSELDTWMKWHQRRWPNLDW